MIATLPYRLENAWSLGGATAKLRIYADTNFTSGGQIYSRGNRRVFFREIVCAVDGSDLVIPVVNLPTTTDSTEPAATVSGEFLAENGRFSKTPFFRHWRVPHTMGAQVSWAQLTAQNAVNACAPRAQYYPTLDQVNNLISTFFETVPALLPVANFLGYGQVRLSRAPTGASIAVGANEPSFLVAKQSRYLSEFGGSVAAAKTSIGTAHTNLFLDGVINITEDTTTPSTLCLVPTPNTLITVAEGKRFDVGKIIRTGSEQIFAGLGDTILAKNACTRIELSMWTGLTPAADDTHAFNQMIASVNNDGGKAYIPAGKWKIKNTLPLADNTILVGAGFHVDGSASTRGTQILVIPPTGGTTPNYGFKVDGGSKNIAFRDMSITSATLGNTVGVLVTSAAATVFGIKFHGVGFAGLGAAMDFKSTNGTTPVQMAQNSIRNCFFVGCLTNFRCNTNNSLFGVEDCYFNVNAGVKCFDIIQIGTLAVRNCEFAGVGVPVGVPYFVNDEPNPAVFGDSQVCRIGGQFISISFEDCQSEGIAYEIVNNQQWTAGTVSIKRGLVAGNIQLNQDCHLRIEDTVLASSDIIRIAPHKAPILDLDGIKFQVDSNNLTGISGNNGGQINAALARAVKAKQNATVNIYNPLTAMREIGGYVRHLLGKAHYGTPTKPAVTLSQNEPDKAMLRIERTTDIGTPILYDTFPINYDFRIGDDGRLKIVGKTAGDTSGLDLVNMGLSVAKDLSVGGQVLGDLEIEGLSRSYGVETTMLTVGANGTPTSQERHGTATLAAGTKTVADATVTANSRFLFDRFSDGGTVGASYSVARNPGVGFTITAKDGAGANQTADTSVVTYRIFEQ